MEILNNPNSCTNSAEVHPLNVKLDRIQTLIQNKHETSQATIPSFTDVGVRRPATAMNHLWPFLSFYSKNICECRPPTEFLDPWRRNTGVWIPHLEWSKEPSKNKGVRSPRTEVSRCQDPSMSCFRHQRRYKGSCRYQLWCPSPQDNIGKHRAWAAMALIH